MLGPDLRGKRRGRCGAATMTTWSRKGFHSLSRRGRDVTRRLASDHREEIHDRGTCSVRISLKDKHDGRAPDDGLAICRDYDGPVRIDELRLAGPGRLPCCACPSATCSTSWYSDALYRAESQRGSERGRKMRWDTMFLRTMRALLRGLKSDGLAGVSSMALTSQTRQA